MKRRYRFRFQRLLHVRELEERDARAQLAERRAHLHQAETRLDLARAALRSAREEAARRRVGGSLDPARSLAEERGLDALALRVTQARERAETARLQVAAAQEAWREREQERRALVELEERERGRHRAELVSHENAEMDEIAGTRAAQARRTAKRTPTTANEIPVAASGRSIRGGSAFPVPTER